MTRPRCPFRIGGAAFKNPGFLGSNSMLFRTHQLWRSFCLLNEAFSPSGRGLGHVFSFLVSAIAAESVRLPTNICQKNEHASALKLLSVTTKENRKLSYRLKEQRSSMEKGRSLDHRQYMWACVLAGAQTRRGSQPSIPRMLTSPFPICYHIWSCQHLAW